jgi:septal ring-binding cell division protein DamX
MSLEGDIGEIDLTARLVELGREQFTGAIRFENDGIIKIIYFKGGDILSASTNDRADSIDEILLRAGKVTREHVKQALAKRKESETLGDALLNLGFITRKELTWARRVQAIGVIRSLNAWSAGSYTIVSDYLPKREEGTLFPLPQIIVELIVTDQDRQKYDRALEGGNVVFSKSPDFDDWYRRLGLNDEAAKIASAVDGHRSAAEIASAVESEVFNVYKLLHAFHILGLVQPAEKPKATPEFSFEHDDLASAGVADAADLWTAPEESSAATEPGFDPEPEQSFQFDTEPEPTPMESPAVAVEPMMERTPAMPSWENPPRAEAVASSVPGWDDELPPPPIETNLPPEKDWGFDDAQIETARRSSAAVAEEEGHAMPEAVTEGAPNRWRNVVIAAVAAIVLTFGGYGGFLWWQGRQEAKSAQLTPAVTPKHPVLHPRPAVTGTTGTLTGTAPLIGSGITSTTSGSGSTSGVGSGTAMTGSTATITTSTSASKPSATTTGGTTAGSTTPMTITAPPALPAKTTPTPTREAKATPPPTAATNTAPHLERNAAGNTVITNTGANSRATTMATDATRKNHDAVSQQRAPSAEGNYTIQFELVCQTSSLQTATKVGGERVWSAPITYRGKSCYRVFWGHYATRDAAAAAIGEIPSSLRGAAPTVVTVPH